MVLRSRGAAALCALILAASAAAEAPESPAPADAHVASPTALPERATLRLANRADHRVPTTTQNYSRTPGAGYLV